MSRPCAVDAREAHHARGQHQGEDVDWFGAQNTDGEDDPSDFFNGHFDEEGTETLKER